MKFLSAALACAATAVAAHPIFENEISPNGEIVVATFGSGKSTDHVWRQENDPVMGGRSTGNWTVSNGRGIFQGSVVDVPKLAAPGFIKATSDRSFTSITYPDVSGCDGLVLNLKSVNDYKGFRFSFGDAHPAGAKFFAYGYKSNFQPSVGTAADLQLPWTSFSSLWDDATGDAIKTCAEAHKYCPTPGAKTNLKTLSVWAEGVAGDVYLEINSIRAYGCK